MKRGILALAVLAGLAMSSYGPAHAATTAKTTAHAAKRRCR